MCRQAPSVGEGIAAVQGSTAEPHNGAAPIYVGELRYHTGGYREGHGIRVGESAADVGGKRNGPHPTTAGASARAGADAPIAATVLRAAVIRASAAWVKTDNPRSGLYPWISFTSSWARK